MRNTGGSRLCQKNSYQSKTALKLRRFAVLSIIVASLSANVVALDIRTAVLSGQQASGAEPGVVFSGFSKPQIDASGHVAFIAELTGVGVGPNSIAAYTAKALALSPRSFAVATSYQVPRLMFLAALVLLLSSY